MYNSYFFVELKMFSNIIKIFLHIFDPKIQPIVICLKNTDYKVCILPLCWAVDLRWQPLQNFFAEFWFPFVSDQFLEPIPLLFDEFFQVTYFAFHHQDAWKKEKKMVNNFSFVGKYIYMSNHQMYYVWELHYSNLILK